RPLDAVYARRSARPERLRWLRARLAARLESLPPFWTVFALTLTETVGAGILALPIALAPLGPLVAVELLILAGLVNLVTIVALSEAFARSGRVRYGHVYFGGLLHDYLGRAGSFILVPALLAFIGGILLPYSVGLSS